MFASRIFILAVISINKINDICQYGLVAQLGERCVRIAEVEGSIPFESTISRKITAKLAVIFLKNGGPDRIRTDDPHNANVVRSQLRYRPILKSGLHYLYN